MFEIDQERLSFVQQQSLKSGGHSQSDGEMCVMEAVAYVAGETWGDSPECTCPVIGAFMRAWNDGLPSDAERDRLLKPLIPVIVGTRSTPAVEQKRATMAADWLIRVHTPAFLRLAKLDKQADMLASLPEITDFAQCPSLMPTLNAVCDDAAAARAAARDAAWDAAWDAARDAAWAAARDAGRAAAWAAARAAARDAAWAAARDAAWAAARGAAWDAAWAAAWGAARAALQNTVTELQASAVTVVKRMAEVRE